MMGTKIALIGHRGVGKTELLERLHGYFPQLEYFDLDARIAERLSNPIYKIFETFGEEYFRAKEIEMAREFLNKKNVIVSLGAGFQLDALPDDVTCIWIRRLTDSDGRIFLNRPALNSKLEPLEDFLNQYERRTKRYFDCADYIYDMPEGMQIIDRQLVSKKSILLQEKNLFKEILFRTIKKRKGVLTLNKRNTRVYDTIMLYDTIELRTDFIAAKDIIRLVGTHNKKSKIILSFRKDNIHDLSELQDTFSLVDWIDVDSQLFEVLDLFATEMSIEIENKLMVSCHVDNIIENLKILDSFGTKVLKSSPLIKSFLELKMLYDWQKKDPKNRFIFPRSKEGVWQWFRCFMLSKQSINFVNDGFSEVADQPTLLDSFLYSDDFLQFAAVIGNPINHSYSPVYHYEYMKKKNIPYFRIRIEEKEFDEALECLESFGLRYASITSPFKESVYRKYQKRCGEILNLKSANTLIFLQNLEIPAPVGLANTDTMGLIKTLSQISSEVLKRSLSSLTLVLWGGGGVVSAVKNEVPHIHLVASRDGKLPKGIQEIDILIWAAPRSLLTQTPKNCTIKCIFDLSYSESSMGLELALKYKVPYFSGLDMFKEQARGQQLFWSQFDECK